MPAARDEPRTGLWNWPRRTSRASRRASKQRPSASPTPWCSATASPWCWTATARSGLGRSRGFTRPSARSPSPTSTYIPTSTGTGPSVLLAKKPGEHAWVIAERLLCEALDPRPKHVAVNRGPVDSTEGRARVVFDRELHQSGHLVARQPAGKAQRGVDACGHAGTRQISAILDPAATYLAPSRSRNPRYAQ